MSGPVFRRAFVVFDQAALDRLGVALLETLAADPRTAGTRILVAVRKGAMAPRIHNSAIYAVVEEPFKADDIVSMIRRIPVETVGEEG